MPRWLFLLAAAACTRQGFAPVCARDAECDRPGACEIGPGHCQEGACSYTADPNEPCTSSCVPEQEGHPPLTLALSVTGGGTVLTGTVTFLGVVNDPRGAEWVRFWLDGYRMGAPDHVAPY